MKGDKELAELRAVVTAINRGLKRRDELIVEAAQADAERAEIEEAADLSRDRVRKILRENGVTTDGRRRRQ